MYCCHRLPVLADSLPGILYTVLRFALSAGFSMGLFMRMDIKTPAANLHLDHGLICVPSLLSLRVKRFEIWISAL